MNPSDADSDLTELIERAKGGDATARAELLGRHRARLKEMVTYRMDPRIAARVDPSDVVQEALIEADQKLSDYCERRPVPFYLWLRQITWERLVKIQRRHVIAEKRSVKREIATPLYVSRHSAVALASRLAAEGTSPSQRLVRKEILERVEKALEELKPMDREILLLRHVEHLSVREVAEVLGVSEGVVKIRRLRAVQKLQELLGEKPRDERGGASRP